MKQGTALVQCKCEHEQQDKMYGNRVRVANTTAKQDKDRAQVRCTVCKTIHEINVSRIR